MVSPNRGSRVVLYLRVSTDKQAQHGHSLHDQRARLHELVERRGYEVVECIADEGWSAKTLDRPGMRQVLELADAHSIDAVIVTKADRLSRSLRDLLNVTAELEERGVALVTADEQVDTSTPIGLAAHQMRGVFSELTRSIIAANTRDGMRAAKAKGIRLGPPPCGWRIRDGRWERTERHALVRRAHALRDAGLTLRQIADVFNTEAVPTGSGRTGTRWHGRSVARLIASPLDAPVAS